MNFDNPISGEVREVALEIFLKDFDPTVHTAIKEKLAAPCVAGIMMFECLQMDSSQCGKRTAMIFGPGCTYKTAEEAAKGWLNDLPSQRQYPQTYFQKRAEELPLSFEVSPGRVNRGGSY